MEDKFAELDVDIEIYKNINKYRLHADRVRFTLFLGYLTAFAAILYYLSSKAITSLSSDIIVFCIVIYVVSILYLIILAIQNWYYVLFAKFKNECEERLLNKTKLRSLSKYAEDNGSRINPNHPAFILVFLIYCLINSYIAFVLLTFIMDSLGYYFIIAVKLIIIALMVATHLVLLNIMMRNWNWVFKHVIKKTSALFNKPETLA